MEENMSGGYVAVASHEMGHTLVFGPFYYQRDALDFIEGERHKKEARHYSFCLATIQPAEKRWYGSDGNRQFYKRLRPEWKRNKKQWREDWAQLMIDLPLGG
jgi:hypothetical protein